MDPDGNKVLFCIYRIRGNYCQFRKQIVALSTSSSSCQQSFSFACSILEYSRKTLQESSKIFCWACAECCQDLVSNRGLKAVRLLQRARLWRSVYQKTGARIRKKKVLQEKTRLTSPEVWALVTSKVWRDLGRPSLSPSRSRRQKEALFAGCPYLPRSFYNFNTS